MGRTMEKRVDGLAFGAALITLGVVALLEGSIDGFPDVWEMIPAIAAVYLAVRMVAGSSAGSRPWLLLAIAVLVLLQVAIVADLALDGSLIWPLLIIAIGIAVLVQGLQRRTRDSEDALAIFGQVQRRVARQLPDPLHLNATFGSFEFDLRDAELKAKPARIEAAAIFGSIELRVPQNWSLDTSGVTATFGSVLEKDPPGAPEHQVQVTGSALFGSIEIKR
ncbi:MAG: hypothetical protein F4Y46_08700 [Chloroflexi bacterium]|nr:hypothetical protein [Chloroflexota bacterium]